MEIEHSELLIVIPVIILVIISITSFITFKYWGPGGIIEKKQQQHK